MINLYIGYDTKETIAYHVCSNSIIRHSKSVLSITPLVLNTLPYKELHNDGSNNFIYTRFLVPYIQSYSGWAIYIDGDMILKEDITELWNLKNETKAVMVVKHNYTSKSSKKYLGSINENYPRKNWSSVILWNCAHPANKLLTPDFIEKSTGKFLHRFSWLDDSEIGELPIEWNWLVDEFGENKKANLIHYTLGTPCFSDYSKTPMANDWYYEKDLMEHFLKNN